MWHMQKLLKLAPLLIVAAVFIPSLIIDRQAGNQPITLSDIAFMLPLVAYFWPLLTVSRFMENSYAYLSKEDKRNYSLLALGLTGILFIMWVMVMLSGGVPLSLEISTTAAFIFSAYDLRWLINSLQKASELSRIVWLHIFVPGLAAAGLWVVPILYTHWPLVPNPLAVFFILRAALSVLDHPLAARTLRP